MPGVTREGQATVMRKTKLLCKMWELCGVSSAQQGKRASDTPGLFGISRAPAGQDWQTRIDLLIIEC